MAQTKPRPIFAPWQDKEATPLIRARNISKSFGIFTAIEDLTLDIYEREFFALLGPSGCGKTTLMRMIAGFEAPTAGLILFAGQDITPLPPNRRPFNMMFQSYALFPHLSVWENIAFGLKRENMPKDRIEARVNEMLRLTRLEKFARRKPHQISGGQRQRVALARALAKAPKLLLLDEPLGALDKKLRQETQFELMDIQERTGTTFIIVTHDQEEAMTVASRVAVMNEGRLVQVSTPAGIYEAPETVYVADFIGDVNIFEGNADPGPDGKVDIHFAEGAVPIHARMNEQLTQGQRVFYAIRPEKIMVAAEPDHQRANHARGRVVDIAYIGNLSTYHVALESGQMVSAQMTNARRLSRRDFTWEDEVWLSWTDTAGIVLTR
ncbi:polyamine ABC transporter ATP-binding protein [Martelella alba]|uniref:Spermidine/putrescine import ATP-binding protein PotA n=1 Tax=Martelella alba TaxID=2590451 RepID=A0A506U6N4_9HYPH|nr:polyamine ABC transporter ATP-binding protein [Martelella alba]TPW28279.1 polyamine ABC transporter ATP-binding protein [Martelella alba]